MPTARIDVSSAIQLADIAACAELTATHLRELSSGSAAVPAKQGLVLRMIEILQRLKASASPECLIYGRYEYRSPVAEIATSALPCDLDVLMHSLQSIVRSQRAAASFAAQMLEHLSDNIVTALGGVI